MSAEAAYGPPLFLTTAGSKTKTLPFVWNEEGATRRRDHCACCELMDDVARAYLISITSDAAAAAASARSISFSATLKNSVA